MQWDKLLEKSVEAQKFSYAPYSKFKVGAALLTKSGKVFTGCNVENTSYGASNCAERTAVFKAVSEGERDFSAIAITSSSDKLTAPCGICRQVLSEFSPDMKIILRKSNGEIMVYTLSELLPVNEIPLDRD